MYSLCYQCTTVIVLWKWVSFFETTYEVWASLFSRHSSNYAHSNTCVGSAPLMTPYSNLFSIKTYFCFTAYQSYPLIVSFLSLKIVSCEACHRPTSQALKTAASSPLGGRTFISCRKSSDASAANWTWRSSRDTKRIRSGAAGRAGPHKYHFRSCRTSHQGCNGCAPRHQLQ